MDTLIPPSQALTQLPSPSTPKAIGSLLPAPSISDVQATADSARTASTLKAYHRDWTTFTQWLDAHGHPHPREETPYPTAILASYLVGLAQGGYAIATISRHLATICVVFGKLSIASPRPKLEDTLTGLRRQIGVAQDKKAPVTRDVLHRMLAVTPPTTLENVRDRAVLLFGLVTALRRSDIARTTWDELTFVDRGIEFRTRRRMKTNQTGDWLTLGIGRVDSDPYLCPVRALQHWRREMERRWGQGAQVVGARQPDSWPAQVHRGQVEGIQPPDLSPVTSLDAAPVFWRVEGGKLVMPFPEGRDVAEIVKKIALRAGLDPKRFAGHSLRAGFVTTGAEAGLSDDELMDHTQHVQLDTLRGYKRGGALHFDAAERMLGSQKRAD